MGKHLIILLAISALVFYSNLDGTSIYILDESKNSTAALEMKNKTEYIVPTVNDKLRLDKPPLHYYFMIVGYSLFGENPFGARFFSTIMGVLTILITYLFAKRLYNEKVAFYAGIILLSSFHFSFEFRLAVPDPYLIFFMTAAMFSFYFFLMNFKKLYLFLFYISLGFATLSKGPIGLVLPAGIIFFYLVFTKNFNLKMIKKIQPLLGLFIILCIAAPWYYWVGEVTNGAWLEGFFMKHNISRFTKTMEGHHSYVVIPLLFTFVGLLPFSVFLFQAIRRSLIQRKSQRLNFYLAICSLFIVLFFCLSQTFLPNYIIPCYPMLAILIADYIYNLDHKKIKIPLIVLLIVCFCIPIAAYFLIAQDASISHLKLYALVFVSLPACVGIGYFFYINKSKYWLYSIAIGFMLTFVLVQYVVMPLADQENPVVKTKGILQGNKVFYYRNLNASYYFYLERPIQELTNRKAIEKQIDKKKNFYIITKKKYAKPIENIKELSKIFEQKDLFEGSTTTIFYYNNNL